MQRAGTASWRFSEGIEQLPVAALYVRDALGLPVPPDPAVPPRLDATVPDRSRLLEAGRGDAAGAEWADWWRALLADDVRMHRGAPDGTDVSAWARQQAAEKKLLFDPPGFTALSDRPALRVTVRAAFPEMLAWSDRVRLALEGGRHARFDYGLVRAVAEETVRRHGVDPGAVSACAVVLPVTGPWWHRWAPGAVVCSVAAAGDPQVARAVLTDAFESGLAG